MVDGAVAVELGTGAIPKSMSSWATDHGLFVLNECLRVQGSRTEGQITCSSRLFLGKSVFFIFFLKLDVIDVMV